MAAVTGILESALYVADLARSLRFYQELLASSRLLEMSDLPARCCRAAGAAVVRRRRFDERGADLGGFIPPPTDMDNFIWRFRSRPINGTRG